MGELTDKIKGNVNELVGKAKQALAGDADDPNRTRADDKLDAEGRIMAPNLLKELGLESSTSNARRVIEGGGVNLGPRREPVSDVKAMIYVNDGLLVRVGKRKIVEIRLV